MKAILNFDIKTEKSEIGTAQCYKKTDNLYSIEITLNRYLQFDKSKRRNASSVAAPNFVIPSTLIENVEENQIENEIISFVKKYIDVEVITEIVD